VSPAQTPPEECEAFLDAYCGRTADCIAQNGTDPGVSAADEKQACIASAKQNLSCGQAVAVGPSYNQCLADVKKIDCSIVAALPAQGDALPTTCEGVIKVLR